jgi:uncharacterized protein (TIRG00374 family)
MKSFWQRYGYWIKLAVSVVLLVLVVWKVNLHTVGDALTRLPWWYYPLGLAINLILLTISTLRWWVLVRNVPFYDLLRVNLVSLYVMFLIPSSISNDGVRLASIRSKPGGISGGLGPIVVDKIFGVGIALALFGISTVLIESQARLPQNFLALGQIAIVAGIVTFGLCSKRVIGIFLEPSAKWLSQLLSKRFSSAEVIISGIVQGLYSTIERKSQLVLNVALAVVAQLLIGVSYLTAAHAFMLNLRYIDCLWLSTTIQIVMLVPIGFAGLGVKDFSLIALMVLLGCRPEDGLAVSMSVYPMTLALALLGWWSSIGNTRVRGAAN